MKKRMEVILTVNLVEEMGIMNLPKPIPAFKHEIGKFVIDVQVDDGAVMGHYNMLEHVVKVSVDAIDKEKLTDLRGDN